MTVEKFWNTMVMSINRAEDIPYTKLMSFVLHIKNLSTSSCLLVQISKTPPMPTRTSTKSGRHPLNCTNPLLTSFTLSSLFFASCSCASLNASSSISNSSRLPRLSCLGFALLAASLRRCAGFWPVKAEIPDWMTSWKEECVRLGRAWRDGAPERSTSSKLL